MVGAVPAAVVSPLVRGEGTDSACFTHPATGTAGLASLCPVRSSEFVPVQCLIGVVRRRERLLQHRADVMRKRAALFSQLQALTGWQQLYVTRRTALANQRVLRARFDRSLVANVLHLWRYVPLRLTVFVAYDLGFCRRARVIRNAVPRIRSLVLRNRLAWGLASFRWWVRVRRAARQVLVVSDRSLLVRIWNAMQGVATSVSVLNAYVLPSLLCSCSHRADCML